VIGSLFLPYQGFREEVFVEIPKGASARVMARQLADAGVVRYSWQFLAARALRPKVRLQAGEYRFAAAAAPLTVLDRIARGDVFYHAVTVPEGSNIFDIASTLDSLGIIGGEAFLKAARDTSLIKDIAPSAVTLEGYLFPSTYRVTRSTTAEQLCRQMVAEFRREWKDVTAGATPPPSNVNEIVTLASIVEKETAVPSERPLVASVYSNRLRLGMKLDSDPTTIYAAMLDNRYRGAIYRSDLQSTNAYNTYTHPGLPPGPIANPGADALKAALNPAATDYLYFVAKPDGSGSHRFSSDYASQQRAVEEYRRAQTQAGQNR
jgi:UPF0755 protein